MAETERHNRFKRFGAFEADLRTAELRKAGVKLKISGQPFQVLSILLERPGDVVTREELQKRLWPDTFVDVERNLNTAINKIREMLGDSAESPRFIETLPRRGYRFIAKVEGESPAAEPHVETPPLTNPKRGERPLHFRVKLIGAIIIAIVAVSGLVLGMSVSRTPRPPQVIQFIKLTNDGQMKFGPLVSDGVRVYFNETLSNGRNVIAQVSVNGGEAAPFSLPLTQPRLADLSKDGTELLVMNDQGQFNSLWVQPVSGASPYRIGTLLAEDAAFGPDRTSVIYSKGHDVYLVNRDGSSARKLLSVEATPQFFRFSPRAGVLHFTQCDLNTDSPTVMGAAADGTGLHNMFEGSYGEWTPDGRFFIFQRGIDGPSNIWALQEVKRFGWQKLTDVPTQLTEGPVNFEYPLPSKDGSELLAIGVSPRAEVVRYDSHSHVFVPYLGISAEGLAFSPDRHWVAYTSYPDGVLWRSKLDGSERLQLTLPPMRAEMPRWSPDGKQLVFSAVHPGGKWQIYAISSSGSSAERLLPSDESQMDVEWSPDGRSVIFGSAQDPKKAIYILDLNSRHVSTLPGSSGFFSPHWSPDSRYISATVTDTQRLMLFDVAAKKWSKVSDSRVGYPMWSHDGRYLYFLYYPEPDKPYRIVRLLPSDRKIETVAEISSVGRSTTGTWGQWFGLAPDESPLLDRDISTQEIYALKMQWP